jgi:hypothetical protein
MELNRTTRIRRFRSGAYGTGGECIDHWGSPPARCSAVPWPVRFRLCLDRGVFCGWMTRSRA